MSTEIATKPKAFAFIDLETSGLSLLKHGILQIGMYVTGEQESDILGYFVMDADPTANDTSIEIDATALAVNKFTLRRMQQADKLENVLKLFGQILADYASNYELILVMHGAKFDTPRLEVAFERAGLDFPWSRRVLCTVSLAHAVLGSQEGVYSLAKLSAKLGITNSMAHDALGDAICTSKVYHELMRRSKETYLKSQVLQLSFPPQDFNPPGKVNEGWHLLNLMPTGTTPFYQCIGEAPTTISGLGETKPEHLRTTSEVSIRGPVFGGTYVS